MDIELTIDCIFTLHTFLSVEMMEKNISRTDKCHLDYVVCPG